MKNPFLKNTCMRRKKPIEPLNLLILVILFIGLGIGYSLSASYLKRMPSLDPLRSYAGTGWEIPTKVYSLDDQLIAEFFYQKRDIVSLSEIPQSLIDATIAIEDHLFFRHRGINIKGIIRAFLVNLRAGKIREGGSSITQQLAKLLFLTPEKTYKRKIQEALLAIKIEREFTKEEILERYFNKVYLGHGAYGVEAASRLYFGKHTKDLTLAESALLAGLIRAPNRLSPITNPDAAKKRQRVVLKRMVELGYITEKDKEGAIKEFEQILKKGKIKGVLSPNKAPYFVEYIRQRLEEKYGSDLLYKGGLRVYTTLDIKIQEAAEKALSTGLDQLNKGRKGQKIEGALVAIDPKTGYIKAMVGGSGFTPDNQLNRVIQAKRQPGSAFKPFLYAAAIDNGFTTIDTIIDEPVVYRGGKGLWTPQNYDGKFYGLVTLRRMLEDSINVASVKLMERLGPSLTIDYARRMGIKSKLCPSLSLALGSSEVTPLEITMAFGVFANQGIRTNPISIRYVTDINGNLLEENMPVEERVLSEETAYVLTNIMEGVITRGTASGAIGNTLGRPVAGKTGTSSDFVDAWFIGYTPDLVASVWIGIDKGRISLGPRMAGGVVAAPIWRNFMESALVDIPPTPFFVPANISFVEVCTEAGLLATPDCTQILREVFIQGTEPDSYCQIHQSDPSSLYEYCLPEDEDRIDKEKEGLWE